jgi:hypothetical protein
MNYPKKSMKKILLSLSLLVLTLSFATNTLASTPASSSKVEQDAGPYHMIMQTNPENLMANQAGTMTMIIQNKATGQPVTGAKVMMMKSTMKSGSTGDTGMGGMGMSSSMDTQGGTAMHEQSTMGSMAMAPGTYMMENMTFSQPGQWNQAITISSSLGETTTNFPVTVSKSGPNLILIGSVVGAVVIAGLLAAMLKRKKS